MLSRIILPAFVAALAVSAPTAGTAQSALAAREMATRVQLADRQRMLSQRMAKAACLMAQGVDAAAAREQLSGDHALFAESNRALRDGSDRSGLKEETSREVRRSLARIDGPWSMMSDAVKAGLAAGRFDPADLPRLDRAALDMLSDMDDAAEVIARVHSRRAGQDRTGPSLTIDLATRQRMLAQRAVKELCLIHAGRDRTLQARRLAETVGMFDLSLTALRFGFPNAGIQPPSSDAMRIKLTEVAKQWAPVKAVMDRVAEGATPTDRDLETAAQQSESMLLALDEAIRLYGG